MLRCFEFLWGLSMGQLVTLKMLRLSHYFSKWEFRYTSWKWSLWSALESIKESVSNANGSLLILAPTWVSHDGNKLCIAWLTFIIKCITCSWSRVSRWNQFTAALYSRSQEYETCTAAHLLKVNPVSDCGSMYTILLQWLLVCVCKCYRDFVSL